MKGKYGGKGLKDYLSKGWKYVTLLTTMGSIGCASHNPGNHRVLTDAEIDSLGIGPDSPAVPTSEILKEAAADTLTLEDAMREAGIPVVYDSAGTNHKK